MSNYCKNCRYDPKQTTGEDACPFSVLYYDFLARHRDQFADNRRMNFQIKNLDRKADSGELKAIRQQAAKLRRE